MIGKAGWCITVMLLSTMELPFCPQFNTVVYFIITFRYIQTQHNPARMLHFFEYISVGYYGRPSNPARLVYAHQPRHPIALIAILSLRFPICQQHRSTGWTHHHEISNNHHSLRTRSSGWRPVGRDRDRTIWLPP
jgi:hypothetical protein